MSFIFSGVFWGLIVLLFGLSIILKAVFGIHFPFLKVFFGLLFIYIGVRILAGSGWRGSSGNDTVAFADGTMAYSSSREDYNIIFGSGTVDLRGYPIPTGREKAEVNVVFGDGRVLVNDNLPAKIELSTAFGSAETADRSANGFGSTTFVTSAYREGEPYVFIEANSVFGRVRVERTSY